MIQQLKSIELGKRRKELGFAEIGTKSDGMGWEEWSREINQEFKIERDENTKVKYKRGSGKALQ